MALNFNINLIIISAFINGFLALSLEILAPRLISPYFGGSPAIWAIVISTFLLGLSFGYWWGAKTTLQLHRLYFINIALLTSLLLYPNFFLFISGASAPLTLKVFLANLIFLPSSVVFGVISPQLAKRYNHSAQESFGYLSSAATVGSILGCLVTSLILFSAFNTFQIIILLITINALLLGLEIKKAFFAVPILIGFFIINHDSSYKSEHQDIEIQKMGHYILLKTNGNVQSALNLENENEPVDDYISAMLAGLNFSNEIRKVLILGLGGGILPKALHFKFPETQITAVEFDPAITELAYKEFNLPTSIKVENQDARLFLTENNEKYDAIFLDCYTTITPPAHLVTVEFFKLLQNRLMPGGQVISNLLEYSYIYTQLNTMRSVFSYMKSIRTKNGNFIALASDAPIDLVQERFSANSFLIADYTEKLSHDLYTDIKSIGFYLQLQPAAMRKEQSQ